MFRLVAFLLTLQHIVLSQSLIAEDTEVRHAFLAADSSKQRIALIGENGDLLWERKIGPLHDLHILPSGAILFQDSWTHLVELDPETNQIIWEYEATTANGNTGQRLEVHAFQRLANGWTMIAESGVSRLIEVDSQGTLKHRLPLQVQLADPHRDTRLVRKLPSGNYLVCHEAEGLVREYDATGGIVWEYPVPLFDREPAGGHGPEAYGNQCFCALRLANGNTLISTGNGHSVLEVTPAKEIAWQLTPTDLPDIQLAWITSLQVLPSGNIVLNNCHAGAEHPQIIEVNRDKQLVWSYRNFELFGNSLTNNQIVTTNGVPIVAVPGTDR